jgi:hypothetical protein
MKLLRKITTLLTFFALLAHFLSPLVASANSINRSARLVYSTGNQSLLLEPGQTFKVAVTFQNTGNTTWNNTSSQFLSIYTVEPRYRESLFFTNTWLKKEQPGRMEERSVAPGSRGTIYFDFTAPQQPGIYRETFHLAVENTAWVTGGLFSYVIEVKGNSATPFVATPPAPQAPITTPTAQIRSAELQAISSREIRTRAGAPIAMQAIIRNSGNHAWQNISLQYANLVTASESAAPYAHPTWNGLRVANVEQRVVAGETVQIPFFLRAPEINGRHTPRFAVLANGQPTGLVIELPVEVTEGNDQLISNPPLLEEFNFGEAITAELLPEPVVRIGVLIVDEETNNEVIITSLEGGMKLQDLAGNLLLEVASGQRVRAWFAGGTYFYDFEGVSRSVGDGLRFIPNIENSPLRIENFDRRTTRRAQFADNTFRNILELRHNTHRNRVWLINELPVELYLRGLAETTDVSPLEYHKALMVAARTFTYHHLTRNYKWPREFFHITAYSWDQVYNGYDREMRSPRIVQAVNETAGQVVTHEGQLAMTPYFSRSDGRTRDWGTVLNGSAPWAVSVPVPCDAGKTLWGHGVGMSLSGALCMAGQGQNHEQILKHFFTNIDIIRKW